MTKEKIYMKDVLQRLLNPKEVLDVRLFNYDQQLKPEIRDFLIKEVKLRLGLLLEEIEGLELCDIYLTGSSASYFYYEKSDINIRADIRNVSCKYLSKENEYLSRFMTSYYSGVYDKHGVMLGKQNVEVMISSGINEQLPLGLYSVLNNKWIIEPQKDITQGADAVDIYAEYERRYYKLQNYLKNMEENSGLNTLVGINTLKKIAKEIKDSSNYSIKNYIIYKMLKYVGILDSVEKAYNQSLKKFLSLSE